MDRPVSETRIAAAGVADHHIVRALEQAESHVSRMTPSPSTEQLKSRLASFRRVLESWNETPPSPDEAEQLYTRVVTVLQLAKATSPTLRIRRIA
jgi:hypothetical protein